MATLNLGRLKPVFRGAWNNATAYNVDDIVVRTNESYISIQAGSNQDPASASAYWTKIAAKGSDGTDLGATLANKEIAFKTNAGALDGIPIGTAGQFLKVNSGATGYEYGAVSSDFVKLASATGNNSANEISIDGFYSTDYLRYVLYGRDVKTGSSGDDLNFRVNQSGSANGSSVYVNTNGYLYTDNTPSHGIGVNATTTGSHDFNAPSDRWDLNADDFPAGTEDVCNFELHIHNPLTTGVWKTVNWSSHFVRNDQNTMQTFFGMGVWKSTQANTGITIKLATGNLTGDFRLYGIKA